MCLRFGNHETDQSDRLGDLVIQKIQEMQSKVERL